MDHIRKVRILRRSWNELPESAVRILCYVMGPIGGATFLLVGNYRGNWSVRFHAIHSLLLAATWATVWTGVRALEQLTPWFLGALLREARYVVDLGFLMLWILLIFAAHGGARLAVIPGIHKWAVRLARRYEKHFCVGCRSSVQC